MIKMIVNQTQVESDLNPGTPTVDYLRNRLKLAGTKIGCREGDCGACTVLVGELIDGKIQYRTNTSCLMPLGNTHGKHIVTIEGINGQGLTPIQQAFIDNNATQCGFCTPGFVMALTAFCLGDKELNLENAVNAVAGNICRCTGYKSIERALSEIVEHCKDMDSDDRINWLVSKNYIPSYFQNMEKRLEGLKVKDVSGQDGYVMGGGTDALIQDFEGAAEAPKMNLIANRKDLKGIKVDSDRCLIGAATTMEELKTSAEMLKMFPRLDEYLKLLASLHIRNMATVGGNIANGSPIGDLSIFLMALNATLHLNHQGTKRDCAIKEFFTGYKQVAKAEGEILEWISFDVPKDSFHVNFEKVSKRVHLDMATVNSALGVEINNGVIASAHYSVGGLAHTIRFMEKTCDFLIGKPVNDQTFREANEVAQTEITPRSRAEYKRLLVKQQLFAHLDSFAPDTLTLEALS